MKHMGDVDKLRTTSACAENTYARISSWRPSPNYLRVRGEYGLLRAFRRLGLELPPRARRILTAVGALTAGFKNYLRVRGEYTGRIQY